jgi:hypothetical protein
MSKHTPGPWEARKWYDDVADVVGWSIAADNHLVPTNDFETDDPEEAKANARLIAAAPDLFDLAEAFREVCARVIGQYGAVHHGIDYTALAGRVNQVLAAVEGESDAQDPQKGGA